MPVACIHAYTITGPTNLKPRCFSSFEIVSESAVFVGTAPLVLTIGFSDGTSFTVTPTPDDDEGVDGASHCTARAVGDDIQIGLGPDHVSEAIPHRRMIVRQQHAN